MRKIKFLLLFTLLTANISFAQTEANKLRSQIAAATGIKKVDLLLKANPVIFNWKGKVVDSIYYYAKLSYDEAKRIGYLQGQANAASKLAGWALYGSRNYPAAIPYALEAVKLGEQLKSNKILSQAYFKYAEALQFENREKNFDEALNAYKKATMACRAIGDKQGEGQAAWTICGMLSGKGDYGEGLSYCQNALALTKASAQKEVKKGTGSYEWAHQLVQFSLLNIAKLYLAAGDYETTKNYIHQTIAYNKKYSVSYYPNDIFAELYIKMNEPDSAQKMLDRFPPKFRNHFYYKNLQGQVFLLKKDFKQSVQLLTEALPDIKKDNKFHSYSKVLIDLATAYSGIGDHSTAINYANDAVKEAEQYTIRPYQLEAYQVLSSIHKSLNNYKAALEYLEKYTKLKESILSNQFYWRLNNYKNAALDARKANELSLLQKDNVIKQQQLEQHLLFKQESDVQLSLLSSNNKLNEQQLRFKDQELKQQILSQQQKQSQLELLDKENRLKDQQLSQQSFIKNALIAGLFLLSLLSFFIVRSLALKRRNDRLVNEKRQTELQQQSAELEMQALRAQMNPHFIFNCLSSINKFILKNESRAASDYLTRFSRLIRRVLTNSQLSMIPLSDEVEMLRLYLDMERLRFSNSFNYNIVYSNEIEPESIYVPPMLLQPFCENAIWHGLMHKEGQGQLDVVMRTESNMLNCTITDNGIGREKAAELKSKSGQQQKSFGLKITTERLSIFNQEKTIDSFYKTEDIINEEGNISGTKVNLNIRYKESVEELI